MKVLFLGPAYPFRGGIAQFQYQWARALHRRGHETGLVTFTEQFPKRLFPGQTQLDPSAEPPTDLSITRITCPWKPSTWLKSGLFIQRQRADILVFSWWVPFFGPAYGTIAKLVKSHSKTRVVFSVHNAIAHEKWPFSLALTRAGLGNHDLLIAHSDVVGDDLKSLGFPPKKTVVVSHPAYDQYKEDVRSKETIRKEIGIAESRVILFFGYIKAYKGLDTLIESMPRLLDAFEGDLKLMIIGEFYDGKEAYREQVQRLNLADKIHLEDRYIEDSKVGQYFKAADLVVLPYKRATQSGILQIAYHFDTPVVTSAVGALPQFVLEGKTGYLVSPDSPRDLADGVISFYKQRDSINHEAEIRSFKGQFSWDEAVDLLESLHLGELDKDELQGKTNGI